uniref:Uncharacterized protein n=1 Tax=Strombidium inclinatum TaxID=197538 RepID=A0A7S3IV84_9SPIT|mmetsp:Transcript_42623/g.65366  ORF Transcript_42623/g.65366 Transcript_42623/m.65366 type:complete len:131 (+) Transcript_42623:384-776(+)
MPWELAFGRELSRDVVFEVEALLFLSAWLGEDPELRVLNFDPHGFSDFGKSCMGPWVLRLQELSALVLKISNDALNNRLLLFPLLSDPFMRSLCYFKSLLTLVWHEPSALRFSEWSRTRLALLRGHALHR